MSTTHDGIRLDPTAPWRNRVHPSMWRDLAHRRKRVHLSQQDLADAIPCHINSLQAWERGTYTSSIDAYRAACAAIEEAERAEALRLLALHPDLIHNHKEPTAA